jgi:hypothetical protein
MNNSKKLQIVDYQYEILLKNELFYEIFCI